MAASITRKLPAHDLTPFVLILLYRYLMIFFTKFLLHPCSCIQWLRHWEAKGFQKLYTILVIIIDLGIFPNLFLVSMPNCASNFLSFLSNSSSFF